MNTVFNLSIPAMKCQGCVAAITNALEEKPGLIDFTVNLSDKSASVTSTIPLSDVIQVIKTAGFDATLQSADNIDTNS